MATYDNYHDSWNRIRKNGGQLCFLKDKYIHSLQKSIINLASRTCSCDKAKYESLEMFFSGKFPVGEMPSDAVND